MEMERFLELVTKMREAQMNFFTTHKEEYAIEAKRLEEEVDAYLADLGYKVDYLPF